MLLLIGHIHSMVGRESDLKLFLREERILFMGADKSDFKYILVIIHRDVAVLQKLTKLDLWCFSEAEQDVRRFKNQTYVLGIY